MNKRGKKLLGSLSIIIVVLVVASMFFVIADSCLTASITFFVLMEEVDM